MSQFTTPFIGELIGDNKWKLVEPFEYHVGSYPSEEIITVPEGFVTDFASVPRVFWHLISPIDKHGKAAVIHDYLYRHKYQDDRKRCDDIFKEAMEVLHVSAWKIFCIYWAVRIFGQFKWS